MEKADSGNGREVLLQLLRDGVEEGEESECGFCE